MSSLSSPGIGSGLDIRGLVSSLVQAETAPAAQRLAASRSRLNVQLSAVGSFRGALANVQTALKGALDAIANAAPRASVSSSERLAATAGAAAAAGTYEVEVLALARAGKLASDAFSGGPTTALGPGSLTLSLGTESFTVNLAGPDTSLTALRDAINAAGDNPGVTATLLNESGGTRLILTSEKTGAANALSASGALLSFSSVQTAQDAELRIDGFEVRSATNTVREAITGVTLTLNRAEPGTVDRLTLTRDPKALEQALQGFVNAYNAAQKTLADLSRYDPATRQAGPLNGDATVRAAQQQLRNLLTAPVDAGGGQVALLSEIGLGFTPEGSLRLDAARLASALADDRNAVASRLAGANGAGTRLDAALEGYLGGEGLIGARTDSINRQLKDIEQRQAGLELRREQIEARYRRQFNGLDSLLAQMNTTSTYLAQQLNGLAQLTRR